MLMGLLISIVLPMLSLMLSVLSMLIVYLIVTYKLMMSRVVQQMNLPM